MKATKLTWRPCQTCRDAPVTRCLPRRGPSSTSHKLFEVVYVVWIHLILNGAPALDFVDVAPDTPWLTYVLLAVALFAFSALVRYWRLTGWRPRVRHANF